VKHPAGEALFIDTADTREDSTLVVQLRFKHE